MRYIVKLELTIDVGSPVALDSLLLTLAKNPGARLYLRNSVAAAVELVSLNYSHIDIIASVDRAKIRGYESPGEKRHGSVDCTALRAVRLPGETK